MSYSPKPKEIEAIKRLSGAERYTYALRRFVDWREIFALRNAAGWAIVGDKENNQIFPIWPAHVYAEQCVSGEFADCEVSIIGLQEFVQGWLDKLTSDGVQIGVMMLADMTGVVVTPTRFTDDLIAEFDRL